MKDDKGHDVKHSGLFTVKHSTLTIALVCVTVGSLASLVVVATTKEADALSTVALALAVLAFSAQLIVTIAQAQSSAAQTRDTYQINAQTRAVLADIQAQSKALVDLQTNQFDKVLNRAINADTVEAAISDLAENKNESGSNGGHDPQVGDPEAIAEKLRNLVEVSISEQRARPARHPATKLIGPREGERTVEDFLALTPSAQQLLLHLGKRESNNTRQMLIEGSRHTADVKDLDKAGFVDLRDGVDDVDFGDKARPVFLSVRGRAICEFLDPSNRTQWVDDLRRKLERRRP